MNNTKLYRVCALSEKNRAEVFGARAFSAMDMKIRCLFLNNYGRLAYDTFIAE
jgi:hypothetical protein